MFLTNLQNLIRKYFFPLSFILYFVLNIKILNVQPFSDDFHHVFNYSLLENVKNPFQFLNPFSQYFKSWGLTYFVLWNFLNFFGEDYFSYRLFNLIIHFINFTLLYLLLKQNNNRVIQKFHRIISFLFLFSPLSILTTVWIFQLKTLLSVFFVLFILHIIEKSKQKDAWFAFKIFSCFYLSLLSKITAICFPFFLLYKFKKSSAKIYWVLILPTFLLAFLYGMINIKGMTYIAQEINFLKTPTAEEATLQPIPKIDDNKSIEYLLHKYSDQKAPKYVLKDTTEGAETYFTPYQDLNTIIKKYIISLQNFGKLITSTLGFNIYMPFYENNLQTLTSFWLYINTLLGLAFLFLLIKFFNQYAFLTLIFFIPISGFFYIPYMKYSYSSDHWFYPASAYVLIWLIPLLAKKSKFLLYQLFFLIIGNYLYTLSTYQNTTKKFQDNYIYNQSTMALETFTQLKAQKDEMTDLPWAYHKLLHQYDFNNTTYYNNLLISSFKTKEYTYLKQNFAHFAVKKIKNDTSIGVKFFLNRHQGLYSEEKLFLISIFSELRTPIISQQKLFQAQKILE